MIELKSSGSEERSAVLKGNRLRGTERGAQVPVFGTLRVIRLRDSTINGKELFGFTKIRIEETDTVTENRFSDSVGTA